MKGIKNLLNLVDIFSEEDAEWQKTIFNKTGALLHINKLGGYVNGVLLSNCGFIDLDIDVVYTYSYGKDLTQYTTVNTI